uniref:EGF-like domain-containing protein n=1 Tax=Romanomermis culicivorax TaxID=13658 RepID=A0A915J9M3_ROMCU
MSSSSPLSAVDGYFNIIIANNFTDQQKQNNTLTISVLGEDQEEENSILASCSLAISDVLSKLAPTTTENLTINWSFRNRSDLYCTISDHLRNELTSKSTKVKGRRYLNDYYIDIKFSSGNNCINQFHVCQDLVKFKTNCKTPASSPSGSTIYSPEKDANACFSKLQHDPLCCPACIDNCSLSKITASDAILPSDLPTPPTTSLLFSTSLPFRSTDPLTNASFPTPPVFPVTKSKAFGSTKSHNDSSLIDPVEDTNTLPIPPVNFSDRAHSIVDHCLPNPCFNNQSCKVNLNESLSSNQLLYLCDCKYPFSGDRCQYFDHCSNNTCKNGATCQFLASNEIQNSTKFYKCVCPAGLTGEFCDSPVLLPPLILTSPAGVAVSHHVNVTETEATSLETSTSHLISVSTTEKQESSIITKNVTIQTAPQVSPCDPNPCLHNGTCEIIKSANYSLVHKCICHPEYEESVNCSVRRKNSVLPTVSPAIFLSTSTSSTTTTTAIQIDTTEAVKSKMTTQTTPPTTLTTTTIIATISTDKLFDCSADFDCNRGRCINGKIADFIIEYDNEIIVLDIRVVVDR